MVSSDLLKRTGVYVILNVNDGKFYIGSAARSFAKRFRNHIHDLERGQHHSQHLQRAWLKHGPEAFVFSPIIFCEPSEVIEQEQLFIDCYRPEYNMSLRAGSLIGYSPTEAARKNMSAARKKYLADPDNKARLLAATREAMARPDVNAKMTAAQNCPDLKKKRSAYGLAMWDDPIRRSEIVRKQKEAANLPHRIEAARANIYKRDSVLPTEKIKEIKSRLSAGESGSSISKSMGVGASTVSRVKNGIHWMSLGVQNGS